jgi:hypothetical protein
MTKLLMMMLGMCLILHVRAANSETDTTQLNSLFFRGTEYTKILNPASGSPYMYQQLPGDRKILYYEQWFTSAELLYDAEDDAVVTRDISGGVRVVMTKEKVKEFYIGSKRFMRVGDAGYFEVLYEGNHSVLVKWQRVPIRKGTDDPVYKTYSKVYVLDKSVLVEVGSGNDLLKITGKDGKRYMEQTRNKGLNFRKDFPNAAAEMMRIADQNGSNE